MVTHLLLGSKERVDSVGLLLELVELIHHRTNEQVQHEEHAYVGITRNGRYGSVLL